LDDITEGRTDAMPDELSMALNDLLVKAAAEPNTDVLLDGLRVLAEALMGLELELESHLGAGRYERTPERPGYRNGTRDHRRDARVGTQEVAIPRVRDGNFFPALLEPPKRAERALLAVVQEAYVLGPSTRRVDALVKALGLEGISKSQVSRVCAVLDAEVERFRTLRLAGVYSYLWVDATFLKDRR
jgi:transposase-like protein